MPDLTGKTVAIIVADFVEEAELAEPRDALLGAGATVKIYAVEDDPVQAVQGDTEPTQKIEVDGNLGDLDVRSIDALVVPGGTVNADQLRVEEHAQQIPVEALDGGLPTAVICPGPWLLVSAGRAQGRRRTSFQSLAPDLRNAGAEWVDEEVVVDDNPSSAATPTTCPLIAALTDALS